MSDDTPEPAIVPIVTDEFRQDALRQAREYGERMAPNHVCDMCAEINLQPWEDETLKEIAGWKTDYDWKPFFRQPPEPPTEEFGYLFDEVFEEFREAFYRNASEPERCDVCLDDDIECGHERHTIEGCPVNRD